MVEDPLLRMLGQVPSDGMEPVEAARVGGHLASSSSWVAPPAAALNAVLARIHAERAAGQDRECGGQG